MLKTMIDGVDYTVFYIGTPINATVSREVMSYQADFMDTIHMDLKRNLKLRVPSRMNQTDMRPLFETYQFLTPGITTLLYVFAM
jgi:hypothetical protein